MRFSIVTPNYNGERFLEKTLNSVIAQRSRDIDLEYIVVDGNSTDKSHWVHYEFVEKKLAFNHFV